MKKFSLILLMAILAIPVMQASKPEHFKMYRGCKAPMNTTLMKSETWGAKYMMAKATVTEWDFEDAAQLDDWTFVDADGDGFNWEYYNNYGLETGRMTCHSGDGVMSSKSYDNDGAGALTPDNWMISPIMELGGTLTFWSCGQDASYAAEVFAVYVCIGEPNDVESFVKVSADITATGEYVEYKFDLTPYQGQEGCFAIRHYNVTDMFMLNIDDVTLNLDEIIIPDPTTPENLTADPQATTADIAWEDADDAAWNLRYRVYNPNTAKTYTWGAEAGEEEWTFIDADGDGYDWMTTGYSGAHGGSNVFWSFSYYSYYAFDPDNWMISPEVPLDGTLSLWAASYLSSYPDNFQVYVTTGDPEDLDSYVAISDFISAPYEWTEYTYDLSQFEGQMGHIAIRHYDSYDEYYLFIDDITLNVPGDPEGEWTYVYGLDATEYTIEGLDPETTYEVQVQAYNSEQVESAWTKSTIFTTLEAGEEPPVQEGIFIVLIDQDGNEYQYNLYPSPNNPNNYVNMVTLEYNPWGAFDPYYEERPVVPFYFIVNGERLGAEEDMTPTAMGPIDQTLQNPLFANENCYTVPVGFTYTIGIQFTADGGMYVLCAQGGMVGVDELNADKAVAGVRYYNVAGQEMQQADGLTIVVTTYTDGSTSVAKVVK